MKKIYLSLLIVSAFAACGPKTYVINGTISDESAEGRYVYLAEYGKKGNIDTAIIKDGKFTFEGKADPGKLCIVNTMLRNRGAMSDFVPEGGTINIDLDQYNRPSGTPLNDELSLFYEEMDTIRRGSYKDYMALRIRNSKKELTDEEYDMQKKQLFENMNDSTKHVLQRFFERNKHNVVGYNVLSIWANSMRLGAIDSLLKITGPEALNFSRMKAVYDFKAKLEETEAGKMYKDSECKTVDGKDTRLSEYIGKGNYTLVTFWAPWYGPAKSEIRKVAELYKTYKKDGLKIVGIAVKDELPRIEKTIKETGMDWPQIYDENGNIQELYTVKDGYHSILFGPDGKVAARNLRGDKLKERLENIYGKN